MRRIFGIDVEAARHNLPADYLSKIKMSYEQEGVEPSHRFYGWIAM
jgi:hypothetical protein